MRVAHGEVIGEFRGQVPDCRIVRSVGGTDGDQAATTSERIATISTNTYARQATNTWQARCHTSANYKVFAPSSQGNVANSSTSTRRKKERP
jgi:hypothetical protein